MTLHQIKGPVVLDIPTDPASLFLVRCLVERLTLRLEFPREEAERMTLAVDEACTNVIRHAYGNRDNERITLTFKVDEDSLEILIRDFGTPMDPSTFLARDLSEVRPGGLGIHFIKAAMDRVEYETPPDGGMLLRMIKFRTREIEKI
jgi:anti-sigma regulatory factor (Ser/Thr protein kinase)